MRIGRRRCGHISRLGRVRDRLGRREVNQESIELAKRARPICVSARGVLVQQQTREAHDDEDDDECRDRCPEQLGGRRKHPS